MRKRGPSIVDVARMAEVSVATASRVINNTDYPVSAALRDRVLRAVALLDFTPDLAARSLVQGRSGVIGVIVHDISDPYYAEIVGGVEDVARGQGLVVMVATTARTPALELQAIQTMRARRVDGILLAGGGLNSQAYIPDFQAQVAALYRQGVAVVATGPQTLPMRSVCPDNRGLAAQMADHLMALGHQRILSIAGPEILVTTHQRLAGFQEALGRRGLTLDPGLVCWEDFSFAGGVRAVQSALAAGRFFTAAFAANDRMAAGALRALRQAGLRVPQDVSVAGVDDIELAGLLDPPLTTVRIPMRLMGQEGARLLCRAMDDGGEGAEAITLATELVVRSSTGPAAPA